MRAGTPVLVWVIYALGVLAIAVAVLSAVVAAVAYYSLDEDEWIAIDVSIPGLLAWAGFILLAAATWLWRRRARR